MKHAACFPQAYAAAATMLHTLVEEPKAVILDIGGFTADYHADVKMERLTLPPVIR